ncbi:Dyp-type peroxidase [Streptomyces actinomycinicus]|uniref:Dyp-type peroxidase n=1 Tax=Streptomyces actinomycinicus TaxID=1695166 RepID=A0A937EQH6_9ACTN|nr:Dyp-type peroxidase [Streptomyces actinomycinicus]MBL1087708.1 Dyp-type peroxidase [Streptomyces actinomycinicus]
MVTSPARPTLMAEAERLPTPPLRTSTEIQGNVLAAFHKDYMTFRYLRFPDATRARGWLSVMLNTVSVTAEVEDFNEAFSLSRRAYGRDPDKGATWVGLSLTYQGLMEASVQPEQVEKDLYAFEALRAGADGRATIVGDDPAQWVFGSGENTVHAVVVVAADTKEDLDNKLQKIAAADNAHGMILVGQDNGETLPGELRGHEHFGFKDGVSQPGISQFHREDPRKPGYRENRLGAELIAPGEFVFGYPCEEGSNNRTGPAWMKDGSFQVVRRLHQDVASWRAAIAEAAKNFTPALDFDGLAARVVGRNPDGTPLARPSDPVAGIGSDLNGFDYRNDPRGQDTPCASHTRKTNPRHAAPTIHTRSHRMLRRGIPYGPPLAPGQPDDGQERGLLFVCYGTSLEEQFEHVQARWANAADFTPGEPGAPTGRDNVCGPGGEAQFELGENGPQGTLDMRGFLKTMGMVYAFTPSMSTLRLLAEGAPLPR